MTSNGLVKAGTVPCNVTFLVNSPRNRLLFVFELLSLIGRIRGKFKATLISQREMQLAIYEADIKVIIGIWYTCSSYEMD
jgi:hypothetical protein